MLSYMGLNTERAQRLHQPPASDRSDRGHSGFYRRQELLMATREKNPTRLGSIQLCHPEDIQTEIKNMGGSTGKVVFIAGRNMRETNADGGTRMVDSSDVGKAQKVVSRLVSMMVVKRIMLGAIAEGYTGGKAMILGNPHTEKTDEVLKAFGEFLLKVPNFTTGTDLNMSEKDMRVIRETAGKRIVGLSDDSSNVGSAEETTAQGIVFAIKNVFEVQRREKGFDGAKIAIQGIGNVGYPLAKMLINLGAKVYAYDIDDSKREHARATIAAPETQFTVFDNAYEIYRVPGLEIFSPNAGDGTIDMTKFPRNRRGGLVILGAANSPLASFEEPDMQYEINAKLMERGIEYVPDFPINLGGLLHAIEVQKGVTSREKIYADLERIITSRLNQIRGMASSDGISLLDAAEKIAIGTIVTDRWHE